MKMYNGLLLAVVQGKGISGKMRVIASCPGVKPSTAEITVY